MKSYQSGYLSCSTILTFFNDHISAYKCLYIYLARVVAEISPQHNIREIKTR